MPFTASGLVFSIWLLKFCYLSSLIPLGVWPTYQRSYVFQKDYPSISIGIGISIPVLLLPLAFALFLCRPVSPTLRFAEQIDKVKPREYVIGIPPSILPILLWRSLGSDVGGRRFSEVTGPATMFWRCGCIKKWICQYMWYVSEFFRDCSLFLPGGNAAGLTLTSLPMGGLEPVALLWPPAASEEPYIKHVHLGGSVFGEGVVGMPWVALGIRSTFRQTVIFRYFLYNLNSWIFFIHN